jgi:hypothetical protein
MSVLDELDSFETAYQHECDVFEKDEIECRKELEIEEKYMEKINELTINLKAIIGKFNIISKKLPFERNFT